MPTRFGWEEGEQRALAAHDKLLEKGVLANVELGAADEVAWLDCDLASLAENRLGEIADRLPLDEDRRESWRRRATTESLWMPSKRGAIERCYWLQDDGRRVGTVALGTSTNGGAHVRVASLYVMPAQRGRGVGARAMTALRDTLGAEELGLRLSTSWTWQRTVRFYVRLGFWVLMWKRELDLRWRAGEPRPAFEIDGDRARLVVDLDDSRYVVAAARRDGDRLVLEDLPRPADRRIADLEWDACSTLSLRLALEGWPLVRSPKDWEESHFSDAGAPEALAYKITTWEAWERKHGFRVDAPRVPGLVYPTWEDFEARWNAQAAALGLD